jgi:hypothetical protein
MREVGQVMTLRDYVKSEIDTLPDKAVEMVGEYILFQKYRHDMLTDDSEYLNAIPGMGNSIADGAETPLSECVPLASPDIWDGGMDWLGEPYIVDSFKPLKRNEIYDK